MSASDPRDLSDCVFVSIASLRLPPPKRPVALPPADLPDVARARHMRRELERAAEYGAALLAALGLPQIVDDQFVPVEREALGDAIDLLVAQLDAIDAPDDDLEEDTDLEKTGDEELDLGWSALHSQIRLGNNTDDGDHTAPERHGCGFVRCAPDDFEDELATVWPLSMSGEGTRV